MLVCLGRAVSDGTARLVLAVPAGLVGLGPAVSVGGVPAVPVGLGSCFFAASPTVAYAGRHKLL